MLHWVLVVEDFSLDVITPPPPFSVSVLLFYTCRAVGDRPLASQMSGGDLDGDRYFLIWDKSLLPPNKYPAMNCNAASA